MSNYRKTLEEEPVLEECFFAFSNQQFEEGIKKMQLQDKKLYKK